MVKYSVIGTSWITQSFIQGASLINGLLLDGVYSRSKEKGEAFARETGAKRVFNDFSELLTSDTDLVYVASPNSCHYEQCKALIENKKHVIWSKSWDLAETSITGTPLVSRILRQTCQPSVSGIIISSMASAISGSL